MRFNWFHKTHKTYSPPISQRAYLFGLQRKFLCILPLCCFLSVFSTKGFRWAADTVLWLSQVQSQYSHLWSYPSPSEHWPLLTDVIAEAQSSDWNCSGSQSHHMSLLPNMLHPARSMGIQHRGTSLSSPPKGDWGLNGPVAHLYRTMNSWGNCV